MVEITAEPGELYTVVTIATDLSVEVTESGYIIVAAAPEPDVVVEG